MQYQLEIRINKPINTVVEAFDNPENLYKWMRGLEKFEHVSGTPGQPGAKSKLLFKMGNRKMEMIETISVRNLPHEFSGTYEMKGVFNIVKNYFIAIDEHTTLYKTDQEFQFKGFMKLMAWLMPGAFKKQSFQYLSDFKNFVEKQY